MAKRMLIDAAHAEETRVVVVDGAKLEQFDFESANKALLKGNIYLAKVARVEPSLQAAFVDYDGNRHGFLAFSEIHPDYYQIPVSDRQALLEQQAAGANGETPAAEETAENGEDEAVEAAGGREEDDAPRRPAPSQRYRIQEVIKRRQILLVQVAKEERGNKGAALTTYISLAGRYCVLMPNTLRGGGISRKIQSADARKRLRSVVESLDLPDGMAVILRTAGQSRTKAEIKRDYDYLLRLWEQIRESTLASTAPALIHEEGNLIKRSIRDLYNSEIDEVLVEGDPGYRVAKSFMKMMVPSHARRVQPYRDSLPLFSRHRVEGELDSMHEATVQLPSGGYIVICPTEALVAIDVNSGRATRERSIEETAAKTNLEAAAEIARQLRLRDLAGLIVIDFIDMDEGRNVRAVERRFKEALQSDRARIQTGRISGFGLLEMSRQRLRPSVQEISSVDCLHCAGSGRIRSVESAALHALRAIEEEGVRGRAAGVKATVPPAVALYLMNGKRASVGDIEARYGMEVSFQTDDAPGAPECRVEVIEARAGETAAPAAAREEEAPKRRARRRTRAADKAGDAAEAAAPETAPEAETAPAAEAGAAPDSTDSEAGGERSRRRRRGRRGGRRQTRARAAEAAKAAQEAPAAEAGDPPAADAAAPETAESAEAPERTEAVDSSVAGAASIVRPKRRRRVRKAKPNAEDAAVAGAPAAEVDEGAGDPAAEAAPAVEIAGAVDTTETGDSAPAAEEPPAVEETAAGETAAAGSQRRVAQSRGAPDPAADNAPEANGADAADAPAEDESAMPDTPPPAPRRGWWTRVADPS